jgi:hypothetical protein
MNAELKDLQEPYVELRLTIPEAKALVATLGRVSASYTVYSGLYGVLKAANIEMSDVDDWGTG